jgi:hypothetical protein
MSKLEVNAVEPQCGTNLTLGASGDTIIIPSGATISNQGTAAGFGPTGAVSWNTTKITADPNPAVTGVGYFADTTSAAFTITLPATPAAGAVVGIADYANTFATNNLTVDRNGSNIGGVANNADLSTNGVSITLVYVDATQGWIVTDSGSRSDVPVPEYVAATGGTVTCCGDYKIHTFTGPGTFTVTSAGNAIGSNSVDYLVVAGGGGGGFHVAGGGGAGGVRSNYPSPSIAGLPVTAQGYPITVGAGAAAATGNPAAGPNGNNSVFSTITSNGGGGGAPANIPAGSSGGSGGGGGHGPVSAGTGGAGNTPPVSPPQGNTGGNGTLAAPSYTGGGGGGAGAVGTNGSNSPTKGGNGGVGSQINIDGNNYYWSGGGGGGTAGTTANLPIVGGNGGLGGGGGSAASTGPQNPSPSSFGTGGGSAINSGANGTNTGGPGSGGAGGAGGANSGGGGGAGAESNNPGGAGGSGIVIIRYKFQ